MNLTKEQENWMKMIRLRELRDKDDEALANIEKYSATDKFLFICIELSLHGLLDIPLTLLYNWKSENFEKILNIQDEILKLKEELPGLTPTM